MAAKKRTSQTDWAHVLKSIRRRRKLTQIEACAMVSLTQSQWSRIEAGRVIPSPPVAQLIKLVFGIR
jgi:transcriptional regulator with XRE-family HTH domain